MKSRKHQQPDFLNENLVTNRGSFYSMHSSARRYLNTSISTVQEAYRHSDPSTFQLERYFSTNSDQQRKRNSTDNHIPIEPFQVGGDSAQKDPDPEPSSRVRPLKKAKYSLLDIPLEKRTYDPLKPEPKKSLLSAVAVENNPEVRQEKGKGGFWDLNRIVEVDSQDNGEETDISNVSSFRRWSSSNTTDISLESPRT